MNKDRLNMLPWRRFRKGSAKWIFSDEAPWLKEMIEKNYGSIKLNNCLFFLTEKGDKQFIKRVELK